MKIFITGSTGFIGSKLIKEISKKHKIITYTKSNGQDILNFDRLKETMKGSNVVIHLAAIGKPFEEKNFEDYFNTNCIGTLNVARAAVKNGVKRFIYASSTSYYGIEKGITVQIPVKERNPVLTQHSKADSLNCRECDIAYSTSKVIAEQILANYGLTKKIEVVLLRLGPTRKTGEYKPFGELKLHLKIENAILAFKNAIESKERLWYEPFTITDDIKTVDISRAKKFLGYNPE